MFLISLVGVLTSYDGSSHCARFGRNSGLRVSARPRCHERMRDVAGLRQVSKPIRSSEGIYFRGLRQRCPQTCATGPWPSFVDVIRNEAAGNADLALAERTRIQSARRGKLFEVWVTVRGKLNTNVHSSPCNQAANRGYGYLGAFPAQIVADSFSDTRLIPAAASPIDLLQSQQHDLLQS